MNYIETKVRTTIGIFVVLVKMSYRLYPRIFHLDELHRGLTKKFFIVCDLLVNFDKFDKFVKTLILDG